MDLLELRHDLREANKNIFFSPNPVFKRGQSESFSFNDLDQLYLKLAKSMLVVVVTCLLLFSPSSISSFTGATKSLSRLCFVSPLNVFQTSLFFCPQIV